MNVIERLDQLRQIARSWSRAREELPLVKEMLEHAQELAVQDICTCIRKSKSDARLRRAACRLEAVRGLAEDLVKGIRSAQIASQEAQELTQGG
jgi:hypothetical protein